ncbi:MAG: VOC family protein [Nakamurella sp.]
MKAKASIGWYEIRVTDVEAATAFYTAVFDVEVAPWEQEEFTMLVDPQGAPMFALERVSTAPAGDAYLRPTWDTEDLESTLALVQSEGGTVTQTRTEIGGGYGWWAAGRDPFGNYLSFSSSVAP